MDETDHNPTVIGLDNIRNIKIFDEEYINQYGNIKIQGP